MKIKILLVAIFCSFVVWQLKTNYSKVTYPHTQVPGGSYRASCNNITMETRVTGGTLTRFITADCLDINGNPKKASISLPVMTTEYLDVTLENINGTLKSFQPQLTQ